MGLLVIILTLFLSVFAFSQIFGSIIYNIIKEQRMQYWLTVLIWGLILYGYYILNVNCFSEYLNVYTVITIVSAVLSLLFLKNE